MPADAKFLDGGRDQFQGDTVIGRQYTAVVKIFHQRIAINEVKPLRLHTQLIIPSTD